MSEKSVQELHRSFAVHYPIHSSRCLGRLWSVRSTASISTRPGRDGRPAVATRADGDADTKPPAGPLSDLVGRRCSIAFSSGAGDRSHKTTTGICGTFDTSHFDPEDARRSTAQALPRGQFCDTPPKWEGDPLTYSAGPRFSGFSLGRAARPNRTLPRITSSRSRPPETKDVVVPR